MLIASKAGTDPGRKRDHNEDSLYRDDELGLYVVSDGMGGHAAGEVASSTAVAVVKREIEANQERIRYAADGAIPSDTLAEIAEKAVQMASRDVYLLAKAEPEYRGMGCTLTILLIAGRKAVMAHVGDSRLYLQRRGTVYQLSADHTLAMELVRNHAISADEAPTHPYAHVLVRSVGTQESVMVDKLVFDVFPGDRFLVCSDGLADYLSDEDALAQRLGGMETEEVPEQLIAFANESGGHDNISVVLVDLIASDRDTDVTPQPLDEVQQQIEALSSIFLFESMSLPRLVRVLDICEVRDLAPDEIFIEPGQRCADLFIVVSGRLKITLDGEHFADVTSGRHFGETTLMRGRPSRATVMAMERTRLLVLDGGRLFRLTRQRPGLGLDVLTRLCTQLGRELDERAVRTVEQCLGCEYAFDSNELF